MLPANVSVALSLFTVVQRNHLAARLGIAPRTLNSRIEKPSRFPEDDKPVVASMLRDELGIELAPSDFLKPIQFGK